MPAGRGEVSQGSACSLILGERVYTGTIRHACIVGYSCEVSAAPKRRDVNLSFLVMVTLGMAICTWTRVSSSSAPPAGSGGRRSTRTRSRGSLRSAGQPWPGLRTFTPSRKAGALTTSSGGWRARGVLIRRGQGDPPGRVRGARHRPAVGVTAAMEGRAWIDRCGEEREQAAGARPVPRLPKGDQFRGQGRGHPHCRLWRADRAFPSRNRENENKREQMRTLIERTLWTLLPYAYTRKRCARRHDERHRAHAFSYIGTGGRVQRVQRVEPDKIVSTFTCNLHRNALKVVHS